MTERDISLYGEHKVSLEYENVSQDGFAYTNWLLFVDGRPFYLGQDSKFVIRVLGRNFGQFIHEAFERAGLEATPARELDAAQRDLLRVSLAAGVVRGLDDLFSDQGEDFFEAAEHGLEPWTFAT